MEVLRAQEVLADLTGQEPLTCSLPGTPLTVTSSAQHRRPRTEGTLLPRAASGFVLDSPCPASTLWTHGPGQEGNQSRREGGPGALGVGVEMEPSGREMGPGQGEDRRALGRAQR